MVLGVKVCGMGYGVWGWEIRRHAKSYGKGAGKSKHTRLISEAYNDYVRKGQTFSQGFRANASA